MKTLLKSIIFCQYLYLECLDYSIIRDNVGKMAFAKTTINGTSK